MNKKLTIILLSFFLFSQINELFSQKSKRIYLDQNYVITTKRKCTFYRDKIRKDSLDFVKDYYKNGDILMTGSYRIDKCDIKHGLFQFYDKGNLLKSKINFDNNKYNGTCIWYYENGNYSSIEQFMKDSLLSYTFFNEDGTIDNLHNEYEVEALFIGGDIKMSNWISNHVAYPNIAVIKKHEERIYVKFLVDKFGKVQNVIVEDFKYQELAEEAKRVVKKLPNWNPGRRHNQFCEIWMQIPINFTLD